MRAVVAGAGGFIGHHLVTFLKERGYWVRGVDLKWPEYGETDADEFEIVDLRIPDLGWTAVRFVDEVYQLAADMGGIGYITGNHAMVARNNSLINLNMLESAALGGVERYFYASSACVYPAYRQERPDAPALSEADAWPAEPEEGYGLEKLYAEKLCAYYTEEDRLETRVARFHNVYGPLGTYAGGREKAPAAICRKVALASDGDSLDIWGDGQQTRSFMHVDDCVEGIYRIMQSDHADPLNLGSDELVTVDQLAGMIIEESGKDLNINHDTSKPQGVRGRNSDNTLAKDVLGWAPSIPLREGLRETYLWIEGQV